LSRWHLPIKKTLKSGCDWFQIIRNCTLIIKVQILQKHIFSETFDVIDINIEAEEWLGVGQFSLLNSCVNYCRWFHDRLLREGVVDLDSSLRVKHQESFGMALGNGCAVIVWFIVPDDSAHFTQVLVEICNGVAQRGTGGSIDVCVLFECGVGWIHVELIWALRVRMSIVRKLYSKILVYLVICCRFAW